MVIRFATDDRLPYNVTVAKMTMGKKGKALLYHFAMRKPQKLWGIVCESSPPGLYKCKLYRPLKRDQHHIPW